MNPISQVASARNSATLRLALAERVAADIIGDRPDVEVWVEGALAYGLAHARSDVDLRIITDAASAAGNRSRIVDGIRFDLTTSTHHEVTTLRGQLAAFDVRLHDIEVFRTVRAAIGDLTRLRTAHRFTPEGWQPVITDAEERVYCQWAVAHQVEQAHSLAEDLVGLHLDGLDDEAAVTWNRLDACTALARCAAAGAPLLGDKWLPSLDRRVLGSLHDPFSGLERGQAETAEDAFAVAQIRTAAALTECWPLTSIGDADAPAAADDQPPSSHDQNVPGSVSGLGWLPHRYSDGWFIGCGDTRISLTAAQFTDWLSRVQARRAG
ncbi:MAG: hypothetical protein ACRCYX_11980 [Dermatophilaceae bacterium]